VLGALEPAPAAAPPQTQASAADAQPGPPEAANEAPALTPAAVDQAAAPGGPPVWRVDANASSIGFGFTFSDAEQGDARFNGRFTRWRADIRFDPNNLPASTARVVIEMASAVDGVALHERNLPTAPWFNVAAHPTATFRAAEFRRLGGANYEARGELTLRGRTRNVTLPFTLNITGNRAVMNGRTTIDRTDFDIGEDTDADEMISRDVEVVVHIEAQRAP
jgi:polyisoprenoid-binding protein YceI